MSNHISVIKRLRQNRKRRLQNRYDHKSARTILKKIRRELVLLDQERDIGVLIETQRLVVSKLDKLAKKNIIHKNKASNLKSKLARVIAASV